jgi:hypothetical protein
MVGPCNDKLFVKKIIQVPSFFFGGPAYFAWSFTGMKAGGLILQSLNFFCRRDINVVFYRFFIFDPGMQQCYYFYSPSFGFGLYFVFVTCSNMFRCLSPATR